MHHSIGRAATTTGLVWMVASALLAGACAARRAPSSEKTTTALATLQTQIVTALAGDAEIRPGLKVANRTTPENRVEVRAYLAGMLTRFGLAPRRQAYSAEGENVYAMLSCGRPSAELVVVGAHYDSARGSPGANDDATGVAVVAAVAEQLVRVKRRTRDVAFVFFDEEERGLRGSRAFAQWLKDEKRPVHSVHTIDQMGWDQDGDRAIELELPYEGARELYAAGAAALAMTIQMHVTTEAGSDHSAFRRLGFKAVGLTEEYRNKDTTPFIHRPGDTAKTVDFAYLASTTRLIAKVIETLATAAGEKALWLDRDGDGSFSANERSTHTGFRASGGGASPNGANAVRSWEILLTARGGSRVAAPRATMRPAGKARRPRMSGNI